MQKSPWLRAVPAFCLVTVCCGGGDSPTVAPTPAPAPDDYTLSGSASSPSVPITVDDEVRLWVNDQPIGTYAYSGVARFQAHPGDKVTLQALDTCQGQYYMSEIWVHRAGAAPARLAVAIANCSVAAVPCIATVDRAAPDRVFFQQISSLP